MFKMMLKHEELEIISAVMNPNHNDEGASRFCNKIFKNSSKKHEIKKLFLVQLWIWNEFFVACKNSRRSEAIENVIVAWNRKRFYFIWEINSARRIQHIWLFSLALNYPRQAYLFQQTRRMPLSVWFAYLGESDTKGRSERSWEKNCSKLSSQFRSPECYPPLNGTTVWPWNSGQKDHKPTSVGTKSSTHTSKRWILR